MLPLFATPLAATGVLSFLLLSLVYSAQGGPQQRHPAALLDAQELASLR